MATNRFAVFRRSGLKPEETPGVRGLDLPGIDIVSLAKGQVNPTQAEALAMIAIQVMANDVAVGLGGAGGYLEMNVYKPLIIFNVTHSTTIMADGCTNFRKFLVVGTKPNLKKITEYVDRSHDAGDRTLARHRLRQSIENCTLRHGQRSYAEGCCAKARLRHGREVRSRCRSGEDGSPVCCKSQLVLRVTRIGVSGMDIWAGSEPGGLRSDGARSAMELTVIAGWRRFPPAASQLFSNQSRG
jgi:hypothetical protein